MKKNSLFRILTNIPILKKKLSEMKRIYQSICPYEDEEAEQMALESLISGVTAFLGVTFVALLLNVMFCGPTVFTFVSPFFAGYYAFTEVLFSRQNKISERLQGELSSFFLNVSHYYQSEHSILNALSKGTSTLSNDIQIIAKFVSDTLTAEDAEDRIYDYVTDADKNLYLKLFLQQCYECFEHGDTQRNEVSVFCETLETFRVDMLRTKIEKQRNNAKLQGLSIVLWLPVLFMGPIRRFGLSLMENMTIFYTKYGLLTECIALATTFLLYRSLNKTKYQHLKTITIHDIYYKIQSATEWFQDSHENWLTKLLKNVACNVPPSVCNTKMFLDTLLGMIVGLTLEVLTAIQNNTVLGPSNLIFAASFGLLSLIFPIKALLLKAQFKKDREFEIDSIQLLMISEMHSKTITLADLLAKMERIASYYRTMIGECLNNLSYDQTKALKKFKADAEKEKDLELSNIVDMLLSIDKLGIEKAFAELKVNRQLGLEERRMNAEIKAEKRKDLHEITSLIPAIIAIIIYVVIPFMYYTFMDLSSITGSIESMSNLFK